MESKMPKRSRNLENTSSEVSKLPLDLGSRNRKVHLHREWTLKDFADRIGLNVSTLTRLEKGDHSAGQVAMVTAIWILGLSEFRDSD
jgi:ribosome-binding protein aMBF1 (putative translation factor)